MKKLNEKTNTKTVMMIKKGMISTMMLDKLSNKGASDFWSFKKKYVSQRSKMKIGMHQILAAFKYSLSYDSFSPTMKLRITQYMKLLPISIKVTKSFHWILFLVLRA